MQSKIKKKNIYEHNFISCEYLIFSVRDMLCKIIYNLQYTTYYIIVNKLYMIKTYTV